MPCNIKLARMDYIIMNALSKKYLLGAFIKCKDKIENERAGYPLRPMHRKANPSFGGCFKMNIKS